MTAPHRGFLLRGEVNRYRINMLSQCTIKAWAERHNIFYYPSAVLYLLSPCCKDHNIIVLYGVFNCACPWNEKCDISSNGLIVVNRHGQKLGYKRSNRLGLNYFTCHRILNLLCKHCHSLSSVPLVCILFITNSPVFLSNC